ncbi:hypothetical protein [Acinetobacter modestus]|uniref:hypothetical protein n=1 Tax=Acinetobacter modestus TaxID=1776740 RepID=UPI003019FB4B
MKKILAIFITVALTGCMSSGVVKTGRDSYMATGNSTPFTIDTGGGGATANAIKLGTKQCDSLGKQFVLQNTTTRPIGAGAQANINFVCVDTNDSDYVRPNITPVPQQAPTVVINN